MVRTRRERKKRKGPEIGIAPLVDLVFLLLIFFILSSALAREDVIKVKRPQAQSSSAVSSQPLVVTITAAGTIHLNRQRIALANLENRIRSSLSKLKKHQVLVAADIETRAGILVRVMDTCRLAGAGEVMLATSRPAEETNQ